MSDIIENNNKYNNNNKTNIYYIFIICKYVDNSKALRQLSIFPI